MVHQIGPIHRIRYTYIHPNTSAKFSIVFLAFCYISKIPLMVRHQNDLYAPQYSKVSVISVVWCRCRCCCWSHCSSSIHNTAAAEKAKAEKLVYCISCSFFGLLSFIPRNSNSKQLLHLCLSVNSMFNLPPAALVPPPPLGAACYKAREEAHCDKTLLLGSKIVWCCRIFQ